MTLVDRRVGGQAIQVLLPVDVVHPDTLGAGDDPDLEVGTAHFLPVPDLPLVDGLELVDGEVLHGVARVDDRDR